MSFELVGSAVGTISDGSLTSVKAADIRSWAGSNGHTVGSRGKMPAAVYAAYAEANKPAEPVASAPKKRAARKASNGAALTAV